jgi:hypothetical protein
MNQTLNALYAETMRRNTHVPGMVREATPHVVRYTNAHGSLRYILWHDIPEKIPAAQLEAIVDAEIADAQQHAGALCWRIHANDAPSALAEVLRQRGFHADPPTTQHFIAPQALQARLASATTSLTVRELMHADALDCYLAIWQEPWPDAPNERYIDDYQRLMRAGEKGMRFFAAFDADAAVAAAYLIHPPRSPMALLCGGVTRTAWQRRGAYHALLKARAAVAHAAGVSTLCVDASAESASVLQKIGFEPQVMVTFFEKNLNQ